MTTPTTAPTRFLDALASDLAALEADGLRRALTVIERVEGTRIVAGGRTLVNFASNDYLGLAGHPKVKEAAANAIWEWGWGATASRLLAGTRAVHAEAERRLAAFRGAEAALLFPTGYAANLGLLQAFAGENDLIASDALNHASLIDACRLSRARVTVYPHRDVDAARRVLGAAPHARRRFLVTDAVFSMDGDLAPLPALLDVARGTDGVLIVDDAHGNGVLGPDGRGTPAHVGIDDPERMIVTATLSKALGGTGGFVCGARAAIDWLVTRARTFIYTTGIVPAAAAAAIAALDVLAAEPERRVRVRANARRLRGLLRDVDPALARAWPEDAWEVPIVSVVLGDAARALRVAARLLDAGFFAPAIRPPTVPEGTARLRISLSADHAEQDLTDLVMALRCALKEPARPRHNDFNTSPGNF